MEVPKAPAVAVKVPAVAVTGRVEVLRAVGGGR